MTRLLPLTALALLTLTACTEESGEKSAASAKADDKAATAEADDKAAGAEAKAGDDAAEPGDDATKPGDDAAKPGDDAAKPGDGEDPAAAAKMLFNTRCATCHGQSGKGDGPAAAGLNPKPRDYTDKAWQKSVTDEVLAKTIVEGGAAVGKSALMPPNPDLKDKPKVVDELVKMIRSFAGE